LEQEAGESAHGAVVAAKSEPLVRMEPDRVVTARRLPLLPLLCVVVSFHAGDTVLCFYSDAYTSA
jgi:hypothetical protein